MNPVNSLGSNSSFHGVHGCAQLGGPDCVAEMTGRRGMLIRAANGKGVVYQARNT